MWLDVNNALGIKYDVFFMINFSGEKEVILCKIKADDNEQKSEKDGNPK